MQLPARARRDGQVATRAELAQDHHLVHQQPAAVRRLRRGVVADVEELRLDARDECQLRVEQRLHRRLVATPLVEDGRQLRFGVLGVAEAEERVAHAEDEGRGGVGGGGGEGDEAEEWQPVEEARPREERLEGGEEHQLREEAARGVLGPEALERVVAGGREEAEDEVVGEDAHAQVDRGDVEEAEEREAHPRDGGGVAGARGVDVGGGGEVPVPHERGELECGEAGEHAGGEQAVDRADEGGARHLGALGRGERLDVGVA
mmetsp:Transcript_3659/g.8820  ORF Transcript_3659/g.8820 Transcript_3659/m.8820 type:complete len:261 (+) Transcript_3659:209-991(+)